MSLTTKQHTNKNYHISLTYDNTIIIVECCPVIGDNMCGYPIIKATYHYTELDKATRTYKRYIKKYTEV